MNYQNTVLRTRKLNLCISCEICRVTCPQNAIIVEESSGQFLPSINKEKCTLCGECIDTCPGIDITPKISEKNQSLKKILIGKYLESYLAHSKNSTIRENSTSGGLITDLVIKLIEDNLYDEFFILKFEKFEKRPVRLKSTDNVNLIFKSAKSKYIPASIYNVVKALKKNDGKKYIIIGTPCVIYGIKKFMEKNNIQEKNHLFLGLFCSGTLNFNILKYYRDKYGKNDEKISKILYRTKEIHGWPGHTKIEFDSGRSIIIHRKVRMELKNYFTINRCLFCFDKLNKNADISFGDCYIKDKADSKGKSTVIIRTKLGQDIFNFYSYLFSYEKISFREIIKSQKIKFKYINLMNAISLALKERIYNSNSIKLDYKIDYVDKTKKLQKKIRLGMDYNFTKINLIIYLNQIFKVFKRLIKTGFNRITEKVFYISILIGGFIHKWKKVQNIDYKNKNNILIFNGKFFNEGAQSMSLIAADKLKQMFPNKQIYHFSKNITDIEKNQNKKRKYKIEIVPWTKELQLSLLFYIFRYILKKYKYIYLIEKISKIIKNTSFIIDLSGFALSSKRGVSVSLYYILNLIIAKKYSIPIYLFPQSFGPFNFPFKHKLYLYALLKDYLEYPKKIFAREKKSYAYLKMFTHKNLEIAYDIVLQHDFENLHKIVGKEMKIKDFNIKPNSVGFIPNMNIIKFSRKEEIYEKYIEIIKYLKKCDKEVYLLWHSEPDIQICEDLANKLSDDVNTSLISKNLNSIELENIIKKFDFIIASRYHSIIQAYRNNIPCIVISWANKYYELLEKFNQLDYLFSIEDDIKIKELMKSIDYLISNIHLEKKKINKTRMKIKKLKSPFSFLNKYNRKGL